MVVDIAPQQQLPEIFTTNRGHHRSSSTHKRTSTTSTINTMLDGHRLMSDELSKKAEQILGYAPSVVDYCRQQSIDFSIQHPPRLNITSPPESRVNTHQISPRNTSSKRSITVEQLVPYILQLVTPPTFTKLPEAISRQSKRVIERREAVLALHGEVDLKLSDDENEDDDNDNTLHQNYSNENQTKSHHSDSNSDDQVSIHSDAENDDETNQTNPNTLSLMDFIPSKHSPLITSPLTRKRSLSPKVQVQIQQNKRKEDLIKSFSSSVNIPIDIKQPTLPITIPSYLFFDQAIKSEDNQQGTSKRYANGSIKHEINTDLSDSLPSPSSTQQKKNKTSHGYDKTVCKQEPSIASTIANIKEESNYYSDAGSSTVSTATVTPTIVQPKKEKPTANVKPLLQSTLIDNVSSKTNPSNVVSSSDRVIPTNNPSMKAIYANLKHMSTKDLNSLARKKKKQADGEKRTFEDIRQSMSLYLESVCYFIQCANDEPILEQRTTLLTATLAMLQHLAYNYQKMSNVSIEPIRQKFQLINCWLQSLIYQLQYNTNLPSIERCANQVTEHFNQLKSPTDMNNNYIYDFSKYMLNSYHSNYYWNKADRLMREESFKEFTEQLLKQNQNRRLTRDDTTIDFIMYIFEAIDLLRLTVP